MSTIFICRAHDKNNRGREIPDEPSLSEWYLAEEINRGIAESLLYSQHDVQKLGLTLAWRLEEIKAWCRKNPNSKAVAVETHFNAMARRPQQRGYLVMVDHEDPEAERLARSVLREIQRFRPTARNRGVCKCSETHRWVGTGMEYRNTRVAFVLDLPCLTVLVEAGYLTNREDAAWAKDLQNRHRLGVAIGKGTLNYLEDRKCLKDSADEN